MMCLTLFLKIFEPESFFEKTKLRDFISESLDLTTLLRFKFFYKMSEKIEIATLCLRLGEIMVKNFFNSSYCS
jgi:hypothetical protein